MKTLLLLLLPIYIFAQNSIENYSKEQLIGSDWIKTDIRLRDNSKIYNEQILRLPLRYRFLNEDSVLITSKGASQKFFYRMSNNLISIPKTDGKLRISSLDDKKMVIIEDMKDTTAAQFRIEFAKSDYYNIGYTPQSYLTQGNDTVYIAQQNYLEPIFLDDFRNPMDFISEKFNFPEWRTAEFTVRFIITKNGEVKGIKVEGTADKYNDNLINAVKKTRGKWLPAIWEGKPVNAEMKLYFDFGYSEQQALKNKSKPTTLDTLAMYKSQSKFFLDEGNYYFQIKNNLKALQSYSKSIAFDPYNINAYYGRVAVYSRANRIDKVCEELEQLKALEQTKAFELSKKYCEKKE